jgi:hypothetical protein
MVIRSIGETKMAWIDKLHQAQADLAAQNGDPWRLPLERLHGQIGDDGIERITTQLLFDILEVPQRSRGAGACRRLAKLMAKVGWMAVRVRGLTRGGYLEQVRGYCRNSDNASASRPVRARDQTSIAGVEPPPATPFTRGSEQL